MMNIETRKLVWEAVALFGAKVRVHRVWGFGFTPVYAATINHPGLMPIVLDI